MALPGGEGVTRLDSGDQMPTEPCCISVGPVVRVCKFRGLQHGDRVFVEDAYWPDFRNLTFTFLNYAENISSGIGWVEVYGGPKRKEGIFAFPVHAIRVPIKKR